MYKVLITTSGTGSRLGKLTEETNKSLISIGNKRVIDQIIACYDKSIPLVITLGYYGEKVQKYVTQTYPHRNITFVNVNPYKGPGSSLGFSLLCAKKVLQCPFIFHCNDTIVDGSIPSPEEKDWDGVSLGDNKEIFNTTNYSSVLLDGEKLVTIQSKGAKTYDAFHIGIVGIKNYQKFWDNLEQQYKKTPNVTTLNDCTSISQMLREGIQFEVVHFQNWIDTGNPMSFQEASIRFSSV